MRSLLKKMDKALISFDKSCKGKFAMSRAPSPAREARALPGEKQYTAFGSGPPGDDFLETRIASQSLSIPARQFGERDSLSGWRGEQLFP
jgi:hypothetical protein